MNGDQSVVDPDDIYPIEAARRSILRWLSLFKDATREIFPDDRAEHVLDCATRIATAFARYMSVH